MPWGRWRFCPELFGAEPARRGTDAFPGAAGRSAGLLRADPRAVQGKHAVRGGIPSLPRPKGLSTSISPASIGLMRIKSGRLALASATNSVIAEHAKALFDAVTASSKVKYECISIVGQRLAHPISPVARHTSARHRSWLLSIDRR